MPRMIAGLLLVALVEVGTSQPVSGQGGGSVASVALAARATMSSESAVLADDRDLRASLQRLERSRLWREAVSEAKALGRVAIVVTPTELETARAARRVPARLFDTDVLGEVLPVTPDGRRVEHVLVVVNTPLVRAAHDRRGSLPAEFHSDLDRILAHEVYGHALPYLVSGTLQGRCPDPMPGQPPLQACAIQRENAIRAELGLGRRVDAGLVGLSLSWATRY